MEKMTKEERVDEFVETMKGMGPEDVLVIYELSFRHSPENIEVLMESVEKFTSDKQRVAWSLELVELLISSDEDRALSSAIFITSAHAPHSRKAVEILWYVLPKHARGELMKFLIEEQERILKLLRIENYPFNYLNELASITHDLASSLEN